MEVATGHFPYPRWSSVFEQLHQVVNGDPPRLATNDNGNTFTAEFVNFVNTWYVSCHILYHNLDNDSRFSLIKEEQKRPKYNKLLQDPFIVKAQKEEVDVAEYVSGIMDEMANNGISAFTTNQP